MRAVLTLVLSSADFACKIGFAAGVRLEKVAAIRAENEGADGRHICAGSRYPAAMCDRQTPFTVMSLDECTMKQLPENAGCHIYSLLDAAAFRTRVQGFATCGESGDLMLEVDFI